MARGTLLWDSDDKAAFAKGHITGAVNIDDPTLAPREQLTLVHENLDPAIEIIAHCQSGNRAARSAVVLADLGFKNGKPFDSCWLGYSSWLSAPAQDEVWTNFGSLLSAIKGLENRFGALEKQGTAKPAR